MSILDETIYIKCWYTNNDVKIMDTPGQQNPYIQRLDLSSL
ncbi:hypothetical protein B4073_3070 [Bacillus subtilis]|nr:hypothetical protein B4068_0829 [Bacillus subtilis]KIN43630.1 hypothetical protein B4073_3070 [Bacillus subtilis]